MSDLPPEDLDSIIAVAKEATAAFRHADALVHPITFDHLGELALGEWGPGPANPEEGA